MSQPAAGLGFSGGGVSPEQAQFAEYTRGQRTIGSEGLFSHGPGMSTGATQFGAVGPAVGEAVNLAETSDQLNAALGEFANAQQLSSKGITQQQLNTAGALRGKISGSTST